MGKLSFFIFEVQWGAILVDQSSNLGIMSIIVVLNNFGHWEPRIRNTPSNWSIVHWVHMKTLLKCQFIKMEMEYG